MSQHGESKYVCGDKSPEEMEIERIKRRREMMKGKVSYFVGVDFPHNLIYEDCDGDLIPSQGEMVRIDNKYYHIENVIIIPQETSVNVILEELD